MAATSTLDLNGLYKQVYANKLETLIPACSILYKGVQFTPRDKSPGGFYHQPVILGQEQGWSYAAADSATPTLNGNVPIVMQDAQVMGFQVGGQAQITYEAAARAEAGGPRAFESSVGTQMKNLKESGIKRIEFNFLYGQTAVAKIASASGVDAVTTNVTIVLAEWAAGFWSGMIGAKFDLYQTGGYGSQTKVNTNGPLSVSKVNTNTRVITLVGVAADITAVNAYIAANANVAELWFQGAYNAEAAGLKRMLTNTGTLFNINAANFDLWNGNQYTVGGSGALTFAELQKSITTAVNRGLDEDVDVLISPNAWTSLLNDQAALRRYTGGNGPSFENGATKLTFESQNGKISIRPHIFVKQGDAFALPMDNLMRVGATDLTFNIPGSIDGKVFIHQPSLMTYEYRCYSNQALFLSTPAKAVYLSGIVNP